MDYHDIKDCLKENNIKLPFTGNTIKTKTLLNFMDGLIDTADYTAVPVIAEINLKYFLELEGEKETIDRIQSTDGDYESELIDYIEDEEDRPCAFVITLANQLQARLGQILITLDPREEKILRMRFGIGCKEHTLEEVGMKLRPLLTRTRVGQIEARALRKLKHPSRSRKLREFLDNPST